jgi:hypothetical protein
MGLLLETALPSITMLVSAKCLQQNMIDASSDQKNQIQIELDSN